MTGTETGHLLYLLLLAAFLLSGMFGVQRARLGKTLQQALTWAGIFALTILVYSQRHILERELFPGTAERVSPTAVAINRVGGSFLANLEVNSVPVQFLVDTGATDVVLSQQDARRVGLNPDDLTYSASAMTANGRVPIAPVRLDSISFAGNEDRNIPASVNSGELAISLLGMAYLNRFERIEIRGNQMLLIRQ
ncbi:MAG: TIGR02281 family clan AA aspartic protease [Pseudomonadota bacterium]